MAAATLVASFPQRYIDWDCPIRQAPLFAGPRDARRISGVSPTLVLSWTMLRLTTRTRAARLADSLSEQNIGLRQRVRLLRARARDQKGGSSTIKEKDQSGRPAVLHEQRTRRELRPTTDMPYEALTELKEARLAGSDSE